MFFLLSKLLSFLLAPFSWILLLIAASFILKKRKRLLRWTAFSLFIVFSNPYLFNACIKAWEGPLHQTSIPTSEPLNIIVLGGYSAFNEEAQFISFSFAVDRLMHALPMVHHHPDSRLILTGGSADIYREETGEAEYMIPYLKSIGINDSLIVVENQSRNTYENALYTTQLIKEDSITRQNILITSAFHMPRAIRCFQKQGLNIHPYSVNPLQKIENLTPGDYYYPSLGVMDDWSILLKEWVGIAVYKVRGFL